MSEWKRFSDFGVTDLLKVTHYRGGKIPQWMCVNNSFKDKIFWYNKKQYKCVESTRNTLSFMLNGKLTKINRRQGLALKNSIPQYRNKTSSEILEEIRINYPDAKLKIPKVGCQLHGDIDAILTIEGKEYLIPWNY